MIWVETMLLIMIFINGTFELKDGCEVMVHFIKDKSNYKSYTGDFKNHKLKSNYVIVDRWNPYMAVSNHDCV